MLDLGSTVLAVCGVALAVGVLCMMGANDVANVLGTAYGAGALHVPVYSGPASLWARIKGAAPLILFAGVFEFAGALFAGASVTEHVSSQLVSGGSARQRAIGALGCLLASFSLVTGSTVAALPVSASHATASAVVASGAYQVWRQRFARVLSSSAAPGQPEAPMLVHWPAVWSMLTAWTMSPFVGFLSGYVLYFICGARCISEEVLGLPLLAGAIIGTLSIFVFTAGPPDLRFLLRDWMAPIAAATSSLAFAVAATVFLVKRRALLAPYVDTVVPPGQSRVPHSGQDAFSSEWQAESSSEEPAHSRAIGLRILMVFTAAALAFAHGGNDVSNGIAPLVHIINYARHDSGDRETVASGAISLSLLALGGASILCGLTLFGYRVMQTVGYAIAELDFATGLAAQTAATLCVLVATTAGIPVSTTQILVAAVAGAAYSQGKPIQYRTLVRIVLAWLLTIPLSASISVIVPWLFQ